MREAKGVVEVRRCALSVFLDGRPHVVVVVLAGARITILLVVFCGGGMVILSVHFSTSARVPQILLLLLQGTIALIPGQASD